MRAPVHLLKEINYISVRVARMFTWNMSFAISSDEVKSEITLTKRIPSSLEGKGAKWIFSREREIVRFPLFDIHKIDDF